MPIPLAVLCKLSALSVLLGPGKRQAKDEQQGWETNKQNRQHKNMYNSVIQKKLEDAGGKFISGSISACNFGAVNTFDTAN